MPARYKTRHGNPTKWPIIAGISAAVIVIAAAAVIIAMLNGGASKDDASVAASATATASASNKPWETDSENAASSDSTASSTDTDTIELPGAESDTSSETSESASASASETAVTPDSGELPDLAVVKAVVLPLEKSSSGNYYGADTVVVDVKPESGLADRAVASAAAAVAKAHESGKRAYARISIFCDESYAAEHPSSALLTTGGKQWMDRYDYDWVSAADADAIAYNKSVIEQCAAAGFDGYIFDNAGFPYAGNRTTIAYPTGADTPSGRISAVTAAVTELRSVLPKSTPVWVVTDYLSIMTTGGAGETGIDIDELTARDVGIAPWLTSTQTGILSYPVANENTNKQVDLEAMLARIESSPPADAAAPPCLPIIRMRYDQSAERVAERVPKALATLLKGSPDRYVIFMKNGVMADGIIK